MRPAMDSLLGPGCSADGVTQAMNPLIAAVDHVVAQAAARHLTDASHPLERSGLHTTRGSGHGTAPPRFEFAQRSRVAPAALAAAWSETAIAPNRGSFAPQQQWATSGPHVRTAPRIGVPWPVHRSPVALPLAGAVRTENVIAPVRVDTATTPRVAIATVTDLGATAVLSSGVPSAAEIQRRIAVLDNLWRDAATADSDLASAFDRAMNAPRSGEGLLDQLAAPWGNLDASAEADVDEAWLWRDSGARAALGHGAIASVASSTSTLREHASLTGSGNESTHKSEDMSASAVDNAGARGNWDVVDPTTRLVAADELVRRGTALLQAGDAAAAVTAFEGAVAAAPEHADAWRCLAEAHSELDNGSAAVAALVAAVEADPYHASSLVALGAAYVNDGNESAALAALTAWSEYRSALVNGEVPTVAAAVARMGTVAPSADPYADGSMADVLIRTLLERHVSSGDADAYVALGVLYNISGDSAAAAAAFLAALQVAPPAAPVAVTSAVLSYGAHTLLNRAGASRANGGDHAGALRYYTRALAAKPKFARAWVNAGISHAALGKHDLAANAFDRALQLSPQAYHVHELLQRSRDAAHNASPVVGGAVDRS